MRYTIKNIEQCTTMEMNQLTHLAGVGFGQGDSPTMQQDTSAHINVAETIQYAYDGDELVAFSLVRSCLWRSCT